jgi:hypothetical protein
MMTDADKNDCKEIARMIVREVMVEHIASCPHGQGVNVFKAKVYGLAIGIGIASGLGTGASVSAIINAFFR